MSTIAGFFRKEKIILKLNDLSLESSEKEKLLKMMDEIAQYRLLDIILEKLEERDKELFLEQLRSGTGSTYIEFLRGKIENIEELLREHARLLEEEILAEIQDIGDNSR